MIGLRRQSNVFTNKKKKKPRKSKNVFISMEIGESPPPPIKEKDICF